MKNKNIQYTFLIMIFAAAFVCSTTLMLKDYYQIKHAEKIINTVQNHTVKPIEVIQIDYDSENTILPEYASLFDGNNDMVGWIKIEGTNIDYPVVQTKTLPNYYLRRDFEGNNSNYGTIYIQEDCDFIKNHSDNVIVYGHNCKQNIMFSELEKYKDRNFYLEHKTFAFDTILEHRTYEIVSVFKTVVYDESGFRYYDFVNADNEDDYYNFVVQCKRLSLYPCDATAEYGDKLITLSTCDFSVTNGRLCVVAKLVNEEIPDAD